MSTPLTIAINAQLSHAGGAGGVEQFLIGLVSGLSALPAAGERYLIVTHPQRPDWIDPYLGPRQQRIVRPWHSRREALMAQGERLKPLLAPLRRPLTALRLKVQQHRGPSLPPTPGESEPFWQQLGAEVVHFPFQQMDVTPLPTLFNPHDLQHLHLPTLLAAPVIAQRESTYPHWCRTATAIATASRWVKDDLISQYQIPESKIQVIPMAPPVAAYPPLSPQRHATLRAELALPTPFALYAAQSWPHKNHLRLVEALARLRDEQGLRVHLVCTGRKNEHWDAVQQRIRALSLEDQVHTLAFVETETLRFLYQEALFTIIPTLFEAASFPMFEAFYEGCPVACSNVTSLPQQAGDAALIFDPTSVPAITEAMGRLATDTALREHLAARGRARIALFTWERTARAYRALYRRLAGHPLSPAERHLLDDDWMAAPSLTIGASS